MSPLTKIYWRARNHLEVALTKQLQKKTELAGGLLAQRYDKRDRIFGGMWDRKARPKFPEVDLANKWRYEQNPYNICTAASTNLGSSYQEGKRFSAKFTMKMMKRLGMVTGNGFSYLRAPLDIAVKYGRLPYEMMPDEVFGPWWEWSKYDITDEMLAEAAKYKSPEYRKVTNAGDAAELLEAGYALFTGMKWHRAMNNPQPPDFYLNFFGGLIGGHAITATGYRAYDAATNDARIRDWLNMQTFGAMYGDNGLARIKDIFAKGMFDVYMFEKIADRSDVERATGRLDGELVKGSQSTIYRVENGQKRAYTMSWDAFLAAVGDNPKIYSLSEELLSAIPDGENIQ